MSLTETIAKDLQTALKAGDAFVVSALRMLRAALQNAEIDARHPLSDEEATAVIGSEVKKLRDSLEPFRAGGRADLVEKTEREIAILSRYLPAQLSEDEIRRVAREKAAALGATAKDFGRVMSEVMKEVKGRADGAVVSKVVKEVLASILTFATPNV